MNEFNEPMPKAKAASNAEPPNMPPAARRFSLAVAQKWLGYAVIAFCLSFFIPAMIVLAPMFGRTYVHVWKVALGLEPDCVYPATTYTIGSIDCRLRDVPAKKGDRLDPAGRGDR